MSSPRLRGSCLLGPVAGGQPRPAELDAINPLDEDTSGQTAAAAFEERPEGWRREAIDFLEPSNPAGRPVHGSLRAETVSSFDLSARKPRHSRSHGQYWPGAKQS